MLKMRVDLESKGPDKASSRLIRSLMALKSFVQMGLGLQEPICWTEDERWDDRFCLDELCDYGSTELNTTHRLKSRRIKHSGRAGAGL